MKPWLRGDLSGVDPRAEMSLLRDAVLGAATRGEDLAPFWLALAELDAVACAELAAGPRAVAHRAAVEASLVAVDALERVLQPSGLYTRLADLAPEAGPAILATAARRHPRAEWIVRLSRRYDPVPGAVHLAAAAGTDAFATACALCAAAGFTEALVEARALEAVLALCRAGDAALAGRAAARLLDAEPTTRLVPWLAAVWGPDLGPLLAEIAANVGNRAAREALRPLAQDHPELAARLP